MVFPQLQSHSLAQNRATRGRSYRTVWHEGSPDISWSDPSGPTNRWYLPYTGLSNIEVSAIESFYAAAEGSLRSFVFFDPFDNCLVWSEEFERAAWQKDPYLNDDGPVAGPNGLVAGRRFRNSGAGPQGFAQRVAVPSNYGCTFSIWLRCETSQSVMLTRRSGAYTSRKVVDARMEWVRWELTGIALGEAPDGEWGVSLEPGQMVEVFGAQLELQRAASSYMRTQNRGGVYLEARFGTEPLRIIPVDTDQYSCDVWIEARK